MENSTEIEVKKGKTPPSGTVNRKELKGAAPKPVRNPKGKVETVKEESTKDTTLVNEEIQNETPAVAAENNPDTMIFNATDESKPEKDVINKAEKKAKKEKKNKKSDKEKTIKRFTLCKLVKNDFLKKHFADYKVLVTDSAWICRKCGRVANDSKFLCKPILLNKINDGETAVS